MLRFESPWALILLLLPAFWLWWRHWRPRRPALRFSAVGLRKATARSWRLRLRWLPDACAVLAWICLTVALARPQAGSERLTDIRQGIAIEMVLDKSSSMTQEMEYGGRVLDRFQVVKRVFADFVFGDGKHLGGRPNDLVGMVTFARYADTICPLTLSHATIRPFLDKADTVDLRNEDGTAIGDAVALAAARLKTAEETLAAQNRREPDSYHLKSKIIILLTDGENNCGRHTISEAGEMAKKWGIKVYSIAVGGERERTFFGMRLSESRMNTEQLEKLSQDTGGLFRLATDQKSLREIYEEIDTLERSEVETLRFVDYRELFVPLTVAGLVLLVLRMLLEATVFRRLP